MTDSADITPFTIDPFTIDVPIEQLDDLRLRLSNTRFAAPIGDDDWSTGVPVSYLRTLTDYWLNEYDWPEQQRKLNRHPQFTTVIDGQIIHFLHVKSAHAGAIPLLLTHGWPGSFVEFVDLIGPLTDPTAFGGEAADAFDVVIPSIPGFGFSTPLTGTEWSTSRIATTWVTLMKRLGYDRFAVQGGDLGASISPQVAREAPGSVIGVHVNGGPGPLPSLPVPDDRLAALEALDRDRIDRVEKFMRKEFGYIAIQSTRPQTLAASLVDSPVGQLAWIIDKFREWTWPHEALPDTIIDRDTLLTNVMLYWLTGTAGTAAFVGYAQGGNWGAPLADSGVPTAAIVFAHDVGIRSDSEQENTIARWTDVEGRGGHFAALEEPELLVDDVRSFFRTLR